MLRSFDPRAPLSIGNGEFAFTADATGLQTFPQLYEHSIPLCTQSQWGWHTIPNPTGLGPENLRLEMFETHGRKVGYPTSADGQKELFQWLRENPHRLHLGRIALELRKADGSPAEPQDLTEIEQTLDLWTGILHSRFRVEGTLVEVRTCCHPEQDGVGVSIESPLITEGRLAARFEFPYGSPAMNAADWEAAERHRTVTLRESAGQLDLRRELDNDRYFVLLSWQGGGAVRREGPHRIALRPGRDGQRFDFACRFSPRPIQGGPGSAQQTLEASRNHWARFWSAGGAMDLAGSRDRRARELERRIVLSQYLTAIQCAGSLPPQETGLTCNSWYGKFHLEMHWWHAAHFALWERTHLLERSLDWYQTILPAAQRTARDQAYAGARWPKMVGPEGRDSPSGIGPLLIWQQPHPIVYAELCYQSHPNRATLERYRDVVFASAEFMASYASYNAGRFVLGPPLIPAQENHPPRETWNPTFELEYWRHGLDIARRWRQRLGLAPEPKWEEVRLKLAPLPVKDGVYLAHENCPQTFTERNRDHPSMLAALGVLPGAGADREIMRNTLRRVFREWRWAETWGWDFPLVAMTAARLGEPSLAVDALFLESPKNTWLANGHNWQRPNLPVYLPGNGGLLAAVAMMAAGWQGGPAAPTPGFPKDAWTVRWERLRPLL